MNVSATEIVRDESAVAALVSVELDGVPWVRPDGRTLHITLWTAPGVPAVYAGTDLLTNEGALHEMADKTLGEWTVTGFT